MDPSSPLTSPALSTPSNSSKRASKVFLSSAGHDGKLDNNLVPKYRGTFQALRKIHKHEGFMGLYKGFHVSVFSQAIASAIFFWVY